jgi:hypothetical protein
VGALVSASASICSILLTHGDSVAPIGEPNRHCPIPLSLVVVRLAGMGGSQPPNMIE